MKSKINLYNIYLKEKQFEKSLKLINEILNEDTSNNLYSLGHKIFEFGDKSDFLKTLTTLCFDHIKNYLSLTQIRADLSCEY